MTEQELAKILALLLYQMPDPLEISRQLLDTMVPMQIVLEVNEDRNSISLSAKPARMLESRLEGDLVHVLVG